MPRAGSPSLALRNVPPEVLQQVRARADRDGWYSLSDLIIALMRDYGAERVTPSAAPPPFDPARAPRSTRD